MVDIYLQDSTERAGYVRVCDFGMTLMRLSYTYEVNTDTRQRIFNSILINNGVHNDQGNLYLDTPVDKLYESILKFVGCVQKVYNMRYWGKDNIRSAFYDDLGEYVTTKLKRFKPCENYFPISEYSVSVDWFLKYENVNFFVFGVLGNDKAKDVTIALLEFRKVELSFLSLVVYEDFEALGKKARAYLTKNADKQYPALNDFREKSVTDINRYIGLPLNSH